MKKAFKTMMAAVLVAAPVFTSCDKWLDVTSEEEIFAEDAFSKAEGYRSALIGIYEQAASPALWGQELTWGFASTASWNYAYATSVPKYRAFLSDGNYSSSNMRSLRNSMWSTAYTAIANCNNLLQEIADEPENSFEYTWEKDLIIAEATGMRALLHFTMFQYFVDAPATGYKGTAIPYVKEYPTLTPEAVPTDEFLRNVVSDLEYAMDKIKPADDYLMSTSHFYAGGKDLNTMDYYLFQGVGAPNTTGQKRESAFGNGFFARRAYRFNYWGAVGLLARVYSYMRDFDNAGKYADMIIGQSWFDIFKFELNSKNTKMNANYGYNQAVRKRRPEALMAFWNDKVCENYATVAGTTYNKTVPMENIFDDPANDYRMNTLYNDSDLTYRIWDGQDATVKYTYSDAVKYDDPMLPVIELPELYFIKAEALAVKGDITGAVALVKKVRDARGCTQVLGAEDMDSFMELLVDEAQRDFFQRGTSFTFLKKLNRAKINDGTPARFSVPEGWYTMPVPEVETEF